MCVGVVNEIVSSGNGITRSVLMQRVKEDETTCIVRFVSLPSPPPLSFSLLSFALFTPSRCNELDIVCGMKVANEIVSSGNGKLALCSCGSVKGG